MKTKLIIVVAIAFFARTLSFGQVKIGICGGINSSVFKSNDVLTTTNNYKVSFPSDNNLGFHFGVIGQLKLMNFFVQPEIVYTKFRHNIDIDKPATPGIDYATQENINRIDIPVLVGYEFSVLKFEAGPVASFVVNNNSDLKKITTYDIKLNSTSFGFQVGAGLQVSKLILDFKYEGGLSNFGKNISAGNSNLTFDSRGHQFIVDVGILL